MRRFLTMIAIVIVLLGVGVFAYFYFFNRPASVVVAPPDSASLPAADQAPQTGLTPTDETPTTSVAPTKVSARLVKISSGPVVPGSLVLFKKAPNASSSPETTVHYIERMSGNVFSYDVQTQKLTRTSNKTLPGIQSAAWHQGGTVALVRYLSGTDAKTINTYVLRADGSEGRFLPTDLASVSVSSTSVLTLVSGINGSVAATQNIDGTKSTNLFTTPLTSLLVSFAGKGQYLAYTKPTATLTGSAFLVDSAGRFSRIAGPRNGLVALASPSGKWVLISYTQNSSLQIELVDTSTREVLALPVATIADKCVWTPDETSLYCGIPVSPPAAAQYPDDWYQGALSFNDRIWRIQVAGRYAQLVLDFSKETEAPLDAVALATDAGGTALVFTNKIDGSLWSFSL